jgi:two-component system chemotaxis sensor kinase CheA
MNKFDISKYKKIFESETREYLDELNEDIVKLEKDPENSELISAIFRNYHTVKGMAGTMEYWLIERIAHSLEDLLSLLRDGSLTVDSDIIDLMLKGTDKIEELVENPKQEDADSELLVERISDIVNRKPFNSSEPTPKEAKKEIICEVKLKKNISLKGARAIVLLSSLEKMGEIVSLTPPAGLIKKGEFGDDFSIRLRTELPTGKIKETLQLYSDIKEVNVKKTPKETLKKRGKERQITTRKDIRVEISKIDKLQNLLSELVIAKETLKGYVRTDDRENILSETERIASAVSALQDEVVKIRMVPIWQVFERFPRIVRDTAKGLGKKVNFQIRGRDIELDRSMLEKLSEPLIHLLRNSIYHGIETPQERTGLGKSPEGQLVLEAERKRGIVQIKVSDDGRGMDVQKILDKAIQRGDVESEEASNLSEKEILEFIFKSGFSTSALVDEISGRGVGMDVVKTRMRSIGGTFDFKTERGKGTDFILKVPLTMAIIKAFLVNIGEETYAIPLTFIEETIELDKKFIKTIHNKEIFLLRDEVIPVKRLNEIFGVADGNGQVVYPTVIVNAESKKSALVTSNFLEQTDIVVKTLPRTHIDIEEFAGVTLLSDGKPALIIDVPSIVD